MGFFKKLYGDNCPICGNKYNPDDFKDELSKKENEISGLCQECQDRVFEEEDE